MKSRTEEIFAHLKCVSLRLQWNCDESDRHLQRNVNSGEIDEMMILAIMMTLKHIPRNIEKVHYALDNVITRNQKSPKVKHYYAVIFHRKSFKPFLNDANFLKVYTNIFLSKYVGTFVNLFAKKTWKAGHINLKFGMWSNQVLLLKKLENNFFIRAALFGANIFTTGISKNIWTLV